MTGAEGAAAVVITGQDVVATGRAALDLAIAEARQRPVTVVDLVGDAPTLRSVLQSDDVHGVADCFAYGVSFAAVTRATTAGPRISLIPSGSEPLGDPEILKSDRWAQLIAQARDRGGLIVFAARSETPGLAALTARVDHVIPAGLVLSAAPVATTPVTVEEPRRRTTRVVLPRGLVPRRRDRAFLTSLGAAAGILAVALVVWFIRRPPSGPPAALGADRTDTLTSTAQLAVADRRGADAGASGALAAPPLVNPQDSALASTFAIRVGTYATYARALRELRHQVKRGAATVSPLPAPGSDGAAAGTAQSFALYVGAARTAEPLDSAARAWARSDGFAGGSVTHTPYALRLTTPVSMDSARRATVTWRARGIPAYSLNGEGGRATVYAGAFVSIDQTAPLTASLHAVGLTPSVAYRVGAAP